MRIFLDNKQILWGIAFLTLVLCGTQLIVSKNKPLLYQTEIDLIEQQQRMNDYPPQYFRVANIMEKRPESRLFFKLQDNFFKIFDINLLPYILVPIVLIGSFNLRQKRYLLITLIAPVITLTISGPNEALGNFCLLPFIFLTTINGVISLLKK